MKHPMLCLALFTALAAAACDDETPKPEPELSDLADDDSTDADAEEADEEVQTDVVQVHFDLESSNFFDFPYPNALRTTSKGTPDLSTFPTGNSQSLRQLCTAVQNGEPGFSPNGAIYFQLDRPIDPRSLPETPTDATGVDANAYVINLSTDSPAYKQRALVQVRFQAQADSFVPANSIVIAPLPGLGLRPGERYAAVLSPRILSPEGYPLVSPANWVASRNAVLPPPGVPAALHAQVNQVVNELRLAGIQEADFAVATVFNTSNPSRGLRAIREAVEALPFAIPSALTYSVSKGVGLYEGTFPLVDYLQGPPPFTEFGQGKIAFDGDGKPQSAREYDTRFALMTPITDPQSPAHYLMVYAPGEAGEYRSFLDNEAKALIPIYLAAISMDAPLSAGRNPTSTPPEELFAQLAVDNLPAWRDIILQRVADLLQLMRFVEIVTIEPEVSPLGASIPLFANPLVLMGNGVGAQVAALAASVEGRIDTTVLAAPAGFLGGMLAERYQEEYATRFALAPGEVLGEDHPIVRLVLQPLLDPADPINFGPRLFLDPEPLPNDVFITLGTQDRVMPPRYVAAFAVSAGIPLIQPEAYTDELWEQAGIAPIPAPVVGNINEPFPNCERPVCAFTAGVLSYDDDHRLLFDNEDVITRYTNYIISAYKGIPLIDQAM